MHIFVMGENVWHDENEWPIARTQWTKYFLHSSGQANTLSGNGTLSSAEPASEPTDSYSYDPAKPVRFITDPSFAQIGGPDDYREVEQRDDVLVYTSDALTEDMDGTTIVLNVLKRWNCESVAVITNLRHYLVMNNREAQIDGGALGMSD